MCLKARVVSIQIRPAPGFGYRYVAVAQQAAEAIAEAQKKGRPRPPLSVFPSGTVLHVDLHADAEVTAEHVRAAPRGVEVEQAIRRRRIVVRPDVENVQDVEVDGEHVADLVPRVEVHVPLSRLGAIDRRAVD